MPNTPNGIASKSLLEILARHGPWAFFAVLFAGIVVVYQLQPASQAQEALAEDRTKLLNAVTASLEQSSESMRKMASAIETLNGTLQKMDQTSSATQRELTDFAGCVEKAHQEQTRKIDAIDEKLNRP